MNKVKRAWAMRTSRDNEEHRKFLYSELLDGRLRQGWGSLPEQDLRRVYPRIKSSVAESTSVSSEERWTWGHWKMLGKASAEPQNAMLVGDIVLVPNMPKDRTFTLCRITGEYRYEIHPTMKDFGHLRTVENLTPGGVSYTNITVSAGLRQSLKCQSRLWWIGGFVDSVGEILNKVDSKQEENLKLGDTHSVRANNNVSKQLKISLDDLAKAIESPLKATLQAAEWETVICDALTPLLRDTQVIHTGGPAERGADIEIHVPNPFDPKKPWIIAVQVKDYIGQIGMSVASQLEQAIISRVGDEAQGRLIAVVLASTGAEPSANLKEAMDRLSHHYGVSVSCIHGTDLMRVLARGLFMNYKDLPIDQI